MNAAIKTDEFQGKPYHPTSFFFKNQVKEGDKVKQTCRVLNAMTKEQLDAVQYLVEDRRTEDEWNANHAE